MTIKIVIGVIIIIASFVFILKNKNQSMMDKLMEKRMKEYEAMRAQQAETDAAETAGSSDDSVNPN